MKAVKKVLACLCAFALVMTMCPVTALAADRDSWYCRSCGETIYGVDALNAHDCGSPSWECPDCGMRTVGPDASWWAEHVCYQCDYCGAVLDNADEHFIHEEECGEEYWDKHGVKEGWECPECGAFEGSESGYDDDEEFHTCYSCWESFEKCPDCDVWCNQSDMDYVYGFCGSCGYEFHKHNVKANLRQQTHAYAKSNRLVIDLTYDVNWVTIYRINPNGSHVRLKSFNPGNWTYYSGGGDQDCSYPYSIEYWDKNRKRDTKYRYYVKYYLKNSSVTVKSGTTYTRTYWTAPKLHPAKVTKSGKRVSWSKVTGADGYCAFFRSDRFLGYTPFYEAAYRRVERTYYTTKRTAIRKYNSAYRGSNYEKVAGVRTYAKHGGKYYSHGSRVRTVKTNLFAWYPSNYRWYY